jgi:hypothetical protein
MFLNANKLIVGSVVSLFGIGTYPQFGIAQTTNALSADSIELECWKPFTSAAKGLLEWKVHLKEGKIAIEVILPKIQMQPRSDSSAFPDPPEDSIRDWSVFFELCPVLTPEDLGRIRSFEKTQAATVRSKRDLRLIYHADIKTKDHWYRIGQGSYHPVHAKGQGENGTVPKEALRTL